MSRSQLIAGNQASAGAVVDDNHSPRPQTCRHIRPTRSAFVGVDDKVPGELGEQDVVLADVQVLGRSELAGRALSWP